LVAAGLRRWAEGGAIDEVAVELLIGLGARFTDPRCPWIRPCRRPGWYWLTPDPLSGFTGRLTVHERRVLTLVVVLLPGVPATALFGALDTQIESRRAAW
jgi:hypothetical protein